jgi:raffinose/stachyose/melibiose transport system substrate-binding protein
MTVFGTQRRRAMRVAIGIAAVAAVGALSACASGGSGGGSNGQTLTILQASSNKPGVDAVVKKFEAANKGVKVDVEYASIDAIHSDLPTRLSNGTAPDIFRMEAGAGTTTAAQYLAARGFLAPITGSNAQKVPKFVLETLGYKGKQYAYTPTLASMGQMFNDDALKKAGLTAPTTWSGVLQFCKDARAKGTIAYANGPADAYENQNVAYALAGQLVYGKDPDIDAQMKAKKMTFAQSGWGDAFQHELDMIKAGCFGDDFIGDNAAAVMDDLANGKTLGTVAYGNYLSATTGSSSTFSLAALPATDDAADSELLVAPYEPWGINAKAKNADLAQKFIDFLASPDMAELYASTANPGYLPMSYDSLGDSYKPSAFLQTMIDYLDKGKTYQFPDAFWPNPQVQVAVFNGMQLVVQNKETIPTLLTDMQKAYDIGAPN